MIRLSLTCLALLAGAAALPARADDLNTVFSCPAAANPSDSPQNPQATPVVGNGWGYGRPTGDCRVLYANASGRELRNVELTIDFGKSPAFDLVDRTRLPDGDTNWVRRNRGPAPILQHPGLPTVHTFTTPAGFPSGTATTPNGGAGYKWIIPLIPAGATNEVRLGFKFEMLAQRVDLAWTLDAHSADTEFTHTTKRVPFQSRWDDAHLQLRGDATVTTRTTGDLWGKGIVSTPSDWGAYANVQLQLYLPYMNMKTGLVLVDDGYDKGNPDHLLVYEPTDLEVSVSDWVSVYDLRYLFTKQAGADVAPLTGPNEKQVIIAEPGTNRVLINVGWLPQGVNIDSGFRFTWVATPSRSYSEKYRPAEGSTMPGMKFCATADGVRTPVCREQTIRYVRGDEELVEPGAFNVTYQNHSNEATPLQPGQRFTTNVDINPPTYTDLAEVRAVVQVAGDAGAQATFHSANIDAAARANGWEIYVWSGQSNFGYEDTLERRKIPTQGADFWVACRSATTREFLAACTREAVTALGLNPDTVQEVAFRNKSMPRRAVENEAGAIRATLTQTLNPTARSSFNGSTFNRRDMKLASVGTTGVLMYRELGVDKSIVSTWNAELDTRSRYALAAGAQSPARADYGGNWWLGASATTEQLGTLACGFVNTGPANIQGPIDIELELPPGFALVRAPVTYFPQRTANNSVNWWPSIPVTDASLYTYSYDAAARTIFVTVDLTAQDGRLAVAGTTPDSERAMRGVSVHAEGVIVAGAPRNMVATCRAKASIQKADGTREDVTVTGRPYFDVTNVAPALQLDGVAVPDAVAGYATYTHTIQLDNAAYDADGSRRPNGATASARDTALFERLTRAGDHPAVDAGNARGLFVSAASSDAYEIWLHTANDPTRGNASHVTAANGWVQCTTVQGAPCDAAALAAAGLGAEQVRWVAWILDEVLVTDAEPRGVSPRDGRTRVDRPYVVTLTARDDGSAQDAVIRTVAEVSSSDATTAFTDTIALDVQVDAACDTRNPDVGYDETELCDGLDNDCDGDTDEGYAGLGGTCTAGVGECMVRGAIACADDKVSVQCEAKAREPSQDVCDGLDNDCDGTADEDFPTVGDTCEIDRGWYTKTGEGVACMVPGSVVCHTVRTPVACQCDRRVCTCSGGDVISTGVRCEVDKTLDVDSDKDSVIDDCDCAPKEPRLFTMAAGAEGSCDVDGDGYCSDEIVETNAQVCAAGPDCDDRTKTTHPGATELCNKVDDDCNEEVDETYMDLGEACSAGLGVCSSGGVRICGLDEHSTTCNAVPGTPGAEWCNGADDDCDGTPDEDFPTLGQTCEERFDACVANGTFVCNRPRDGFPSGVLCALTDATDSDRDRVPDSCDCAPNDSKRSTMQPGFEESCDFDGDGFCAADIGEANPAVCTGTGDCDDADAARNPGATELCNGIDDNCSTTVDESFDGIGTECTAGEGVCAASGVRVCSDDGLLTECDADVGTPTAELCNGLDDDCDGETDEEFATLGTACSVGLGVCSAPGTVVCAADGLAAACDATPGTPGVESCNDLDDDCDGETDEDAALRCDPSTYSRTGGGLASRLGCTSFEGGALALAGLAAMLRRRRRTTQR